MKGKNMILLSVAVLAIGLFVLPQTMAMFVGQHTWFSVRTSESQYELCEKCHVNEVAEWKANTGAHATYNAEHPGCFCHQINETALEEFGLTKDMAPGAYGKNFEHWNTTGNITGPDAGWYWRSNNTPHAAVIIDCVDCHYTEMQQINNPDSAHYAFWNQTNTVNRTTDDTDNNTVCMACHTHTHLNITWTRIEGLVITANHTDASKTGAAAWDLTSAVNETPHTSRVLYDGGGNSTYLKKINDTYWATWNWTSNTWE